MGNQLHSQAGSRDNPYTAGTPLPTKGMGADKEPRTVPSTITPWPNHNGSPPTGLAQTPAKASSVATVKEEEVSPAAQSRTSLEVGQTGTQKGKVSSP